MEVQLSHKSEILEGTICNRKRTSDGLLVGTENRSPILETRENVVEFGYGNWSEYTANTIIEQNYNQVDNTRPSHTLLMEDTL